MVVVVVMLAQYRSVPQNSPQVDPRAQHFVSQVVLLTTQYWVFRQQTVELTSEPGVGQYHTQLVRWRCDASSHGRKNVTFAHEGVTVGLRDDARGPFCM